MQGHDLTHLQVCPTLRRCQESTWALYVCAHFFVLNFCCDESGSLSRKSSHPDTELLFQSLFLVCTEEVPTGNHCATCRAPSEGMPVRRFFCCGMTCNRTHGVQAWHKTQPFLEKYLVIRPGYCSTRVKCQL